MHVCAKIRTKVWALMCLTAIHCLVEYFFLESHCANFFLVLVSTWVHLVRFKKRLLMVNMQFLRNRTFFHTLTCLTRTLSRSLYFCFFVSVLPLQLHILCVYAILWMACTLLWSHWTRWNKSFAREWKGKKKRTNRKSAKNVNKVYVNVALKRTNEPNIQ